jgi:hypothetical protein
MMKQLPERFQFRHVSHPGFTHSCKRNAVGDYEVTWARGWAEYIDQVPWRVISCGVARVAVADGKWIVVEDAPKQKEQEVGALPDEFCFQVGRGAIYQFTKVQPKVYSIVDYKDRNDSEADRSTWFEDEILEHLESGAWKMCDAPNVLTPEQERLVSQYQEQLAALDSSIKINEQTIYHHQLLISSYRSRQDDLHEKIADITGEESPKVAKAKAMKVELEKLK